MYQTPNKELAVMLAAAILGMLTAGWVKAVASAVFCLAGAVWSYAEITKGVNWLRRSLGVIVLSYLLVKLVLRLHA